MRFCEYCGALADTLDHVVPLSVSGHRRGGHQGGRVNGHARVRCCRECNCLLGNRYLLSVPDRAGYLVEALQVRYARLLDAAEWSDEELAKLGPNLRKKIRLDCMKATEARRRIKHCRYVASKDPENWDTPTCPPIDALSAQTLKP